MQTTIDKSVIEFYESVVKTIGLKTKYGMIFKADGEEWTYKGVPIVIPTGENIDTAVENDSKGNLKINKIIFSPVNEGSEITNHSSVYMALNQWIKYLVTMRFIDISNFLTTIYINKDIHQSLNGDLIKFMSDTYKINKKTYPNIVKEILRVTETTNLFDIVIKKRFLQKDIVHKRGLIFEHNFKSLELSENEKSYLEKLYEFIIGKNPLTFTSNSVCPAFSCLMELNKTIIDRTNGIIQNILKLPEGHLDSKDISRLENLILDTSLDMSIEKLENIKNKSSLIPVEGVTERVSLNKQSGNITSKSDFIKPINTNQANMIKDSNKIQNPIPEESDEEYASRILGFTPSYRRPVYNQQNTLNHLNHKPWNNVSNSIDTPPWL